MSMDKDTTRDELRSAALLGTKQTDALRIAEQISDIRCQAEGEARAIAAAADSLCRQHACIAELEAQLEAVGAGGMEPLRRRCLHQISEPAVAQAPVASIYITNDGQREFDDWRVPLPVGRNELFAAPQPAAQALDAARVFWQQHTPADALSMEMAELHADAERAIRAALAAPAQVVAPGQAGEREAFENWVFASGRAHMLKRDDRNDWYADLTVTAWWTAWQARAARGAAQAAPVDAATWQPIASAPKDGKAILLRSKNGRIADGLWSAANSHAGFWAWAYVHQEPVEWMPKPGSPAARAQEQQP